MPNIEGGVMANGEDGGPGPPIPFNRRLGALSEGYKLEVCVTVHRSRPCGLAQSKLLSFKIFYHCDCAVHCNLSGY